LPPDKARRQVCSAFQQPDSPCVGFKTGGCSVVTKRLVGIVGMVAMGNHDSDGPIDGRQTGEAGQTGRTSAI